jgi:hypothetical protein
MSKSLPEMIQSGMEPEAIYDAIESREHPSPLDLTDLYHAAGMFGLALKESGVSHQTREGREQSMQGLVGAVAFGCYIGLLCARLGESPSVQAMTRVVCPKPTTTTDRP